MLSKIVLSQFSNTPPPNAATITNTVPANKKGFTSFSAIFSSPMIIPKTTKVHASHSPAATNPKITARITPIKNVYPPNVFAI